MSSATHRFVLPLVLLLLVACGSSTPSAPPAGSAGTPGVTPSVPSSPSPSPSPSSISPAAVLAAFGEAAFAFEATVSGDLKVAAMTLPITGKQSFRTGDSYSLVVVDAPSGPKRTERIVVQGKGYTRSSDTSPWFESPEADGSGDFGRALRALRTIHEQGTVIRDGRTVQTFVTGDGSLSAADLGVTTPAITDFSATMKLFVVDAAKLVGFAVAADWKQPGPAKATIEASMTLDFAITGNNPTITAPAPDEVWDRLTSKRHGYSIGHPADMTVVLGKGTEPDLLGYSDAFLFAAQEPGQPKASVLRNYVAAYVAATRRDLKVQPESQTDIVMAGHPGKLLRYHLMFDGQDSYQQVALTLSGRDGYFVSLVGPRGQEEPFDAFFETLLGTFTITGS